MQSGRSSNRSGMTTVALQGKRGGQSAAEWTLAPLHPLLEQGGYSSYFAGKWHLGEADYALPDAQGYDEIKHTLLYRFTEREPAPGAIRVGGLKFVFNTRGDNW